MEKDLNWDGLMKMKEFWKDILPNLHNSSSDVSCVSDTSSMYERIRLEKLTFAYRVVSASTGISRCNFAILQSDTKTSLYEIPGVPHQPFLKSLANCWGKQMQWTISMIWPFKLAIESSLHINIFWLTFFRNCSF